MKKFAIAATVALSMTAAVPAIAEDQVSDNPFISSQMGPFTGSLGVGGSATILASVAVIIALATASSTGT